VAELPGCGTTGETIEEIEVNIKDAIETYIDALKTLGKPAPQPVARKLEIAIA
jgi:predicted RNase H-like HicB family nuclease